MGKRKPPSRRRGSFTKFPPFEKAWKASTFPPFALLLLSFFHITRSPLYSGHWHGLAYIFVEVASFLVIPSSRTFLTFLPPLPEALIVADTRGQSDRRTHAHSTPFPFPVATILTILLCLGLLFLFLPLSISLSLDLSSTSSTSRSIPTKTRNTLHPKCRETSSRCLQLIAPLAFSYGLSLTRPGLLSLAIPPATSSSCL